MSNGFGNNGSNSGHRVSRKDEKQQRRDEVNGDQHKTGELKKTVRPAHEFNGGEKKNGNSHLLGMHITPINHERTDILRQIDDLELLIRNPDAASMDHYKMNLTIPQDKDLWPGCLADLRARFAKLIAGTPEPGSSPRHDTGPVQDR